MKFNKKKIPPCYWIAKSLFVFVHPNNKIWTKIEADVNSKKETIRMGWNVFSDTGHLGEYDKDPATRGVTYENGWITFCGHKLVVKKVKG
jgi:hypothetical protein